MPVYTRDQLITFGVRCLEAMGTEQEYGRIIAEAAADTEAMGVTTHGMATYPYFDSVIPDKLDPRAVPEVVRNTGPTAVVDGNMGYSQLTLHTAAELGLAKVREYGTAVIMGRNCAWLAGLGIYLLPLAREGFLAQLWAQTSTCIDAAPVGGYDPRFSTNPVAFAFPTDGDPSICDMATTSISMGKLKQMAARGEQAPEPIFLDRQGELSCDPNAVLEGGTILFLGGDYVGYKGYGMSLFNEALAAAAGGSCNNPQAQTRQCFTLILIDPELFGGREYYMGEIQRFIGHVKSSRLRNGYSDIRIPGERSIRHLNDASKKGIHLGEPMTERLNALAGKYGFIGL